MLVLDMSKLLSQLVGVPDQLFAVMISQLESASGKPSVDIKLATEIRSKVISRIRELGLDPNDTTPEELHSALQSLVSLHDRFLVQRLGGTNNGDLAFLLPRIKKLIDSINIPKNSWVIKSSSAKKLIKSVPPKRVMKQLGYRSVDSMLKREPINEIMVGVRITESKAWQDKFVSQFKHLQPSDFENREIEVLLLDGKKWGAQAFTYAKNHKQNISHSKEMGVVAILPLPIINFPGITIILLPTILFHINEIRTYSTYFKHHQMRSDFGHILVDAIRDDSARKIMMAGQHFHWRVIHHHYGSKDVDHPDFFEPHILPEDLFWRKSEEILFRIEPALYFWQGLDYVGQLVDQKPISFNLMDVATGFVNNTKYEDRYFTHMRDSIWNELLLRYLKYPSLDSQVRLQIEKRMDNAII